jgi:high mobility group protein B1
MIEGTSIKGGGTSRRQVVNDLNGHDRLTRTMEGSLPHQQVNVPWIWMTQAMQMIESYPDQFGLTSSQVRLLESFVKSPMIKTREARNTIAYESTLKKLKADIRKPLSAFFHFNDLHRAQLKLEHPHDRPSDIVKRLGNLWKALTPVEARRYHDLARQDKERYEREVDHARRQARLLCS